MYRLKASLLNKQNGRRMTENLYSNLLYEKNVAFKLCQLTCHIVVQSLPIFRYYIKPPFVSPLHQSFLHAQTIPSIIMLQVHHVGMLSINPFYTPVESLQSSCCNVVLASLQSEIDVVSE